MNQHFYINLKERPENNAYTITELKKLGIKKPNRFEAIKHEIGLVGCVMSHIACLEKAKELKWNYCIIFEDDIKIESKNKLIEKFNKYINYDFDVLYLGCWNCLPPIPIEKDLSKVVKAWCTHAMVVKCHYYDTLIDNYKTSLKYKLQYPNDNNYNIDEYLKILQYKDKWYCITPIHITQRDGWSDSFNCVRNLSNTIKVIPQSQQVLK